MVLGIIIKEWKEIEAVKGMVDDIEVRRFGSSPVIDDGYETKIHLLFNDPVDPNTLLYHHLLASDFSERVDNPTKTPNTIYETNTGALSNFGFQPGSGNKEVYFFLKNLNKSSKNVIPKGEIFKLDVSKHGFTSNSGIKNITQFGQPISNQLLINPGTYTGETELPGIIWNFESFIGLERVDYDNNSIELVYSTSFNINKLNINKTESNYKTIHSESNNYIEYSSINSKTFYPNQNNNFPYNQQLVLVNELDKDKGVEFRIAFGDNDGLSEQDIAKYFLPLALPEIFIALGDNEELDNPLEPYQGWSWKIGLGAFLASYGLWILAAAILLEIIYNNLILPEIRDKVDAIGQIDMKHNWYDKWFGAHPSINKTIQNGKIKASTTIKLKKTMYSGDNSTY